MICTYCKSRVLDGDRKCPSCGSTVFVSEDAPRSREAHREENGGGDREPEVRYQTIHQTIYVRPEVSRRNRWVALLFCFLGGVIGLHRFYVGKIGTGILYLFTGGLFGIGIFVDFIVILVGSFRDKDGLRLSS